MITLEMDLTLQKVEKLKEAILKHTEYPADKQVLLISGGEALESQQDVGHYPAGTDTNPIFLFSISVIESDLLPKSQTDHSQDIEVKEQIEDSMRLAANHSTVVTRAQLAQRVYEYSRDQLALCKRFVHYQHLQQQGWAAAVANLDDILVDLKKFFDYFERSFYEHLQQRDKRLDLLSNFPQDIKLLEKIPLLPALSKAATCNIRMYADQLALNDDSVLDISPCQNESDRERMSVSTKNLSLLDWILPRGFHEVEFSIEKYKNGIIELNTSLLNNLNVEYGTILSEARKADLKEIKGLEDRLYGLESLMRDGMNYVSEQKNFAESFLSNQTRSLSVKDDSIYPNLCKSQIPQLEQMYVTYQKIRDIRKRCIKAKDELCCNIIHRLKWLLFVENKVNELSKRIYITRENIKRIESQLLKYEQVHSSPKLYFSAVAEVVRRQHFKENFVYWANRLSSESNELWEKEVAIREAFLEQISSHFLKDLFPGLNDLPPAFATQPPATFDEDLPKLTVDSIELLRETVPEICSEVRFEERDAVPKIIFEANESRSRKRDLTSSITGKEGANGDVFASAIASTLTPRTPVVSSPKYEICTSPEHVLLSRPASLIRDQPESETDTEEFEKVCGSISDGTYSPMEPDRAVTGSKSKTRTTQETLPSPVGGVQSPPAQYLQEYISPDFGLEESSYSDSSGVRTARTAGSDQHKDRSELEPDKPHSQLDSKLKKTDEGEMQPIHFEDLTQESIIESLRTEVMKLTNKIQENASSPSLDCLSELISRLLQILNRMGETVVASPQPCAQVESEKLQELRTDLELKANQLNDAHREIEIYQEEIRRQQSDMLQMTGDFEEEKRHLVTEKEEALNRLTLEHELEMETVKQQCRKEDSVRTNEMQTLKQKLTDVETLLVSLNQEKDHLKETVLSTEASFNEREKKLVDTLETQFEEKHKQEKMRIEEKCEQQLGCSLREVRLKLEHESHELLERQKREMEEEHTEELRRCRDLWEAQKEEQVDMKMKELESRLAVESAAELEKAKQQFKMDVEGLRSRFRLVTTDRSPSETSLEKFERGDFVEMSVHDTALQKLQEELQSEKEQALAELRRSLEETYHKALQDEKASNEEKRREERKKIEIEKQELFNAAVKEVSQDKERVIENLRLKVEFLTDEKEKLLKASKAPEETQKEDTSQSLTSTQTSCEAHTKEIERLQNELHRMKRISFITERQADFNVSLSDSSSPSQPPAAADVSSPEFTRKLLQENKDLRHAVQKHTAERSKISVHSCQPFDYVLIVWDEQYAHYRVLLEGHTSLHFLHSDSYESLGLSRENPQKQYCLAEVVKKEFCQAKKDENRFRIPKGTKFYRVVARAYPTSAGQEESRKRKTSVMGSPPNVLVACGASSKPSSEEGEEGNLAQSNLTAIRSQASIETCSQSVAAVSEPECETQDSQASDSRPE